MQPDNSHWSPQSGSLDFTTLQSLYRAGQLTPTEVVQAVYDRIVTRGEDHVWIHLCAREQALAQAQQLEWRRQQSQPAESKLPLYGLPFAIKDNIDVAGLPTTAACPQFVYTPEISAPVVERIIAAGGILIGKTNLDQFAAGVVGVRSPFGIARNPFDERYIPGGSVYAQLLLTGQQGTAHSVSTMVPERGGGIRARAAACCVTPILARSRIFPLVTAAIRGTGVCWRPWAPIWHGRVLRSATASPQACAALLSY